MKRVPHEPDDQLSPAEQLLLDRLESEKEAPHEALWELALFYKNARQFDKALTYFRQRREIARNLEEEAACLLKLGQIMEGMRDYPQATRYYEEAVALEPRDGIVSYYINNNLGFSLNTLGDFVTGEIYCRKAIEIDPAMPNAHKNLGIALAGQGWHRDAAECFVVATQQWPEDSRAFNLLTELLEHRPELEAEFGDVARLCREAVEQARVKIH